MIITTSGPKDIGQVKMFFEFGSLFLSPEEYQTESRWSIDQKKLLIDTVFQGLDIPKLYFWKIDFQTLSNGYPEGPTKKIYQKILEEKRKNNDEPNPYVFEVVDGQQRIRTFLEYMGVKPPFNYVVRGNWEDPFPALTETQIAKGKFYHQLNPEQRIKFEGKDLTIMILENATIDQIREMFLRLQNGTPLNSQQKRDAMGSNIGRAARALAELPFFKESVNFTDDLSGHKLVASQMLNLEIKGKLSSCTSSQLDKLYKNYIPLSIEKTHLAKSNKVVSIMGEVFNKKNASLNRSYALSLYSIFSNILNLYSIPKTEYKTIEENFNAMDLNRTQAKLRDYKTKPDDEIFSDLSLAMSSGTDGLDAINTRNEIMAQYIFQNTKLDLLPDLDPNRNFTFDEKLILYRAAKELCELECNGIKCNRRLDFDQAVVDHIIPHSKGGRTELKNGRLAHEPCNISRGNRDTFDPKSMCKFKAE